MKHLSTTLIVIITGIFLAIVPVANAQELSGAHAIAMYGTPKYAADFTHFDYTNPDAPKGGEFSQAAIGTFDTLNPYTLKGMGAAGLGFTYETLLGKSDDEVFTEYGKIAETIDVPADRSSITFHLNPKAHWHDGQPITADDVVWTFNTLLEKGHPFYRAYYAAVQSVDKLDENSVKFTFKTANNRELPLIMGQMPVLPKHYWEGKDFTATTLDVPLGSGPYKVKSFDAGRSITYERVADYWGADLPVNKGKYNFDTIRIDYYRDADIALQALFAGEYDYRFENIAKNWALSYDTKAVRDGIMAKQEIEHGNPTGMQAFVINTRRPYLADKRVRKALAYAFDFEWSNKQFAFSTYKRTHSYFSNSDMASSGVPEGKELDILNEYKDQLPTELFTQAYIVPETDGSGNNRDNLRKAVELLQAAGYTMQDGAMVDITGNPLKIEFLEQSPAFEKWILPFIANLKKIGVEATLRMVDSSQYQNRIDGFDFDITVAVFGQSLSPGNEQADYWSSEKADVNGSRNLMGIKNPVVDSLIDGVIHASDYETLVATTRALDRVLLWGEYVIPQWHINTYRLAYWNKFSQPDISPEYDLSPETLWWTDKSKAAEVQSYKTER